MELNGNLAKFNLKLVFIKLIYFYDIFVLKVSKAYSKVWSFREDALLALYKELKEYPASTPKEDAKAAFRAAVFLIKRAIDDKVFAVSVVRVPNLQDIMMILGH